MASIAYARCEENQPYPSSSTTSGLQYRASRVEKNSNDSLEMTITNELMDISSSLVHPRTALNIAPSVLVWLWNCGALKLGLEVRVDQLEW